MLTPTRRRPGEIRSCAPHALTAVRASLFADAARAPPGRYAPPGLTGPLAPGGPQRARLVRPRGPERPPVRHDPFPSSLTNFCTEDLRSARNRLMTIHDRPRRGRSTASKSSCGSSRCMARHEFLPWTASPPSVRRSAARLDPGLATWPTRLGLKQLGSRTTPSTSRCCRSRTASAPCPRSSAGIRYDDGRAAPRRATWPTASRQRRRARPGELHLQYLLTWSGLQARHLRLRGPRRSVSRAPTTRSTACARRSPSSTAGASSTSTRGPFYAEGSKSFGFRIAEQLVAMDAPCRLPHGRG